MRESFVSQAFAGDSINEAVEALERVALYVAFVQPKRKFVNVSAKMLFAGVVVDANNPALHDRENALDAISGHVIADVFAAAVVDGFVFEKQSIKAAIDGGLVSVERRANSDVLVDFRVKRRHVGVIDRHSLHAAFALAHRHDGGFSNSSATGLELLGLVLVFLDSANIGFVNLDNSLQLFEVAPASLSEAVKVQSEQLRLQRRLKAEERAAKIGTKLLFPLVFFLFPALFLVLVGPAVLSVLENFPGVGTR